MLYFMPIDEIQKIVSLCKRRGFVFPSSEIYGGFGAVYDLGPYGVELENNIKALWWKEMVQENENIVGLDSAIFMHPRVWEASGHIKNFTDPLVECKQCHHRFRADHVLEEVGVLADEKMSEGEINRLLEENKDKLRCQYCGAEGSFSLAKNFNLLVKSNLGNFTGDWKKNPTYLRGETCQGIYVNFKNVLNSTRQQVPFGVAQIGKAFRNEITARQFIFRQREFSQMEMQYFVSPKEAKSTYQKWREKRWRFYREVLGIKERNLRWHEHENLVFYAREAWDIEYNFPFGFKEIEGIHNRGDYDLSQHSKFSGQDLSYRDPESGEKYIPYVVETSAGVERSLLAVLVEAYTEEEIGNGTNRTVLKLPKKLAPIKVAVFPLLRNKPRLVRKAREVFNGLKSQYMCEFDDSDNIGKRYRRQDEIGTPYCLTIDFETLEDNTITIRDRDTMEQERVNIKDLAGVLENKLK